MPLVDNSTDEMYTLNKYLRILTKLNYSNISTQCFTKEDNVLIPSLVGKIPVGVKGYCSDFSISIDSPNGSCISIRGCGRDFIRELAEKQAVKEAVIHLYRYCLKNGIRHLNEGSDCKPAFVDQRGGSNEVFSTNYLMKQLPFFNKESHLSSGIINDNLAWQRAAARGGLFYKYHSNFQNIDAKRHYSTQAPFEETVSGYNVAGLKRQNVEGALAQTAPKDEFDKEHADTMKKFPAPKNFVGNFFQNVRRMMKINEPVKSHTVRVGQDKGWLYTLTVSWPENAVFRGTSETKKEAGRKAAVLCIEWLQKLGKVDDKGQLKLIDKEVIMKKMKKPLAEIKVNASYVGVAEELIGQFTNSKLEEKLKKRMDQWESNNMELFTEFGKNEGINSNISENLLFKRNKELYSRLKERKLLPNSDIVKLPITKFRNEISELIKNNQVLIIKGEPGCGKSTQVPQIIIDDLTEEMKATDCNIVVTQPRRISAISLAERVASERHEAVGDVVGYQVRLQSVKPRRDRGCILFCSTGILLRKLLSNPDMQGISHVIIDEAHERDLNTDFMLLLTKRAAARNPNLKIIIMSATINPELFQNYFDKSAALHIPGFTYPVTTRFLDNDIARITGMRQIENSDNTFPIVNVRAISRLIRWINRTKPPGAILVFLPGWSEIRRLNDELCESAMNDDLLILPVHSRLSHADQKKIFCSPPQGMRKVILATNIAETSITIDDVNYVIDSGAHKEERVTSNQSNLAIDNQWVSQASARQRRGRAGRVAPGECYHLYTKEKYDSFDQFPLPEVHRVRLEMSVLNSKTYSGNEKAEEFLKQLPEPPSTEMIQDAVKKLQWAGALDEDEDLTALGTRISVFTTHPLISKALVHSYLFKCVNPMVMIATILSSDVELFPGTMGDKIAVRASKKKFSSASDHVALASMFNQWENLDVESGNNFNARRYAESILVSNEAFRLIGRLQHLVGEHLYQCGLLDNIEDYKNLYSDCNTYSENKELLKGVLLSGLGNVLSTRNWDVQKGVLKKKNVVFTESGQRATISSESVNYKRSNFPSPFMTYFMEVRSEQQRSVTIRDTSVISPLTLVLFQCATLTINKCNNSAKDLELEPNQVIISIVYNKKTLNIVCDERTAQTVIKLRRIIWSIVGFLVRESGNPVDEVLYDEVAKFHKKMLSVVNKMLNEQSDYIETEEPMYAESG